MCFQFIQQWGQPDHSQKSEMTIQFHNNDTLLICAIDHILVSRFDYFAPVQTSPIQDSGAIILQAALELTYY